MPASLKNSAVAIGLEKVNFHSNPKDKKSQRTLKLLHNCAHFTCQQSNAQNLPSQTSKVCELRTSRGSSWIQKRQSNQRSNCQQLLNYRQKRGGIPEKNIYLSFIDYSKAFDCVDHNKLKEMGILKEMEMPNHFICYLGNLYAGQEARI